MNTKHDDPLDLTLRTLLERLLTTQHDDSGWVNVRSDNWPWRQLVAAAERGEVSISRVGRKLLMRREELDRWLTRHQIPARKNKGPGDEPGARDGDDKHIARLLEDAGYRRKRP